MRPRQDIVSIFSTYLQCEADGFKGWLQDPRLRESVTHCLAQGINENTGKHDWALYWHQNWRNQTHRLAFSHLGAYLQEAGYWAAYKFTRFQLKHTSFADCFQIAFTRFEQGLNSFQPGRGKTLESFAKLFFASTIRNELRRIQEVDACSDWALLRKTSRKRFVESLKNEGLDRQALEEYRLAWMCFQHLYAQQQETGTQQLTTPDDATWQKIAHLYNQERFNHLAHPSMTATAELVEDWLKKAANWIRNRSSPAVKSLNAIVPGMDSGEMQDRLQAQELTPMDKLVEQLEQNSRQAQQQQLRQFLEDRMSGLNAEEQQLVQLYYEGELTQQQIAQQLGLKQYKISRQLTRIRKKLLDALVVWSQDQEGITPTPENIEIAASLLEDWLHDYFEPADRGTA